MTLNNSAILIILTIEFPISAISKIVLSECYILVISYNLNKKHM